MANVNVTTTREVILQKIDSNVVAIISTLKTDLNMIFRRFLKFIFQVQKIS